MELCHVLEPTILIYISSIDLTMIPIEETMEALHDLVKAGKVRALGASAMYGYQFYNMQLAARDNGWTPFSAMENHYNLLYREDERELLPICKQMKVSLMPYSPLAAGHLARPQWKSESLRGTTDRVAMGKYDKTEAEDMQIVKRVAELAEKYNCKMSQIAIAWQWAKGILSPIIGVTKTQYLDDSAGAFDIKLTAEDLAYLEEPYVPHEIVGAIDKNPAQGFFLKKKKKRPFVGTPFFNLKKTHKPKHPPLFFCFLSFPSFWCACAVGEGGIYLFFFFSILFPLKIFFGGGPSDLPFNWSGF